MATLTNAEVRKMWRSLYRRGEGKEQIKADIVPDRAGVKAIFQALEDWFEGERPTIKAAIDSAAGRTLTGAAAKKYARAWLRWKWGGE